jgi:hypothetical protein
MISPRTPMAGEYSAQADFSRQHIEGPSDFRLIQAITPHGDEEVFGDGAAGKIVVSPEMEFATDRSSAS